MHGIVNLSLKLIQAPKKTLNLKMFMLLFREAVLCPIILEQVDLLILNL